MEPVASQGEKPFPRSSPSWPFPARAFLAIWRRLVEKRNGPVEAESAHGEGREFPAATDRLRAHPRVEDLAGAAPPLTENVVTADEHSAPEPPLAAPVAADRPEIGIARGIALWKTEQAYFSRLAKFAAEQSGAVRKIGEHLGNGDLGQVSFDLHRLKGTAGVLDLGRLTDEIERVEGVVRDGGDVQAAIPDLHAALDRALAAIAAMVPLPPPGPGPDRETVEQIPSTEGEPRTASRGPDPAPRRTRTPSSRFQASRHTMSNGPLLIVDDEQTNLDLLESILGEDHDLVQAHSGKEALALAARHHPSLILLDVRMPDLDGLEVCCRLKADPSTEAIPVIFVTAMDEVSDEASGFTAGCVDYLVKPVSPAIVRARVRTHLSLTRVTALERSYRDAVYMLGEAGHHNDNDTGVHIWRMAAYSKALAEASGWSLDQCHLLELAAPMHDTGKLGIPDEILRKPGSLDPDEWVVMRTHSRIGYDILSKSDAPVFQMAAGIALHHHEKWEGSGYPDGLSGPEIEESARIVAIADVFDALSMKRPYKDPWPLDRVLYTMHDGSAKHFDPVLLERFFGLIPRILKIKADWDAREAIQSAERVAAEVAKVHR